MPTKSVRLCWPLREADTGISLALRREEPLAAAGMQARYWSTIGAVTAPDDEIMARAIAGNCVVLGNDPDVGAILAVMPVDCLAAAAQS